ncbi:MAG: hypothetical protein P8Y29_09985, partial [Gemmatimonadota bacterium]
MTTRAVEFECRSERRDSMFDRRMALGTLDVVLSEVDLVDDIDILVLIDSLWLVVAGKAAGLTRLARTAGYLFMTADARRELIDVPWVVDHKPGVGHHTRRIEMAAGTSSHRLSPRAVLEVTQKTRVCSHRYVITLDDLGMTSRAAQLLSATQLAEVLRVAETDPLII